jgi:hypothetical protein
MSTSTFSTDISGSFLGILVSRLTQAGAGSSRRRPRMIAADGPVEKQRQAAPSPRLVTFPSPDHLRLPLLAVASKSVMKAVVDQTGLHANHAFPHRRLAFA